MCEPSSILGCSSNFNADVDRRGFTCFVNKLMQVQILSSAPIFRGVMSTADGLFRRQEAVGSIPTIPTIFI